MDRKIYIERRLMELSHKEDKDILDVEEEKNLEKELEDIYSKNIKKESYKLPFYISMYDMCYCCANCKTKCGRRKAPVGVHTASDFSSVCSDYEEE
jgi:hypothetical protein